MHNHHLKCNFFSLFSFLVLVCMLLIFFTCTHFVLKCTNFYFYFFAFTLQFVWFVVYGIIPTHSCYKNTKKTEIYIPIFLSYICYLNIFDTWVLFPWIFIFAFIWEYWQRCFIYLYFLKNEKKAWIGKLSDILEITCKQ